MTDGVGTSAETAEMLADSLDSNNFWRSARVVRSLLTERDTLRQQLHDARDKALEEAAVECEAYANDLVDSHGQQMMKHCLPQSIRALKGTKP